MKSRLPLTILTAAVAGIFCGQMMSAYLPVYTIFGRLFRREPSGTTLAYFARDEKIPSAMIEHEYELLKAQHRREKSSIFSTWIFRRYISENLRWQLWLDRHVTGQTAASENECREYYAAHQSSFALPIRFHAAHLFLAAPPDTPDEIIEVKRRTIEELAHRLKPGGKLGDLVGLFSEDEATKQRGGDLNYFSSFRMPADFVEAVGRMRVGEISGVIRTKLGFHLVQLIALSSARSMTFEEAHPEIVLALENTKRRQAVASLAAALSHGAILEH